MPQLRVTSRAGQVRVTYPGLQGASVGRGPGRLAFDTAGDSVLTTGNLTFQTGSTAGTYARPNRRIHFPDTVIAAQYPTPAVGRFLDVYGPIGPADSGSLTHNLCLLGTRFDPTLPATQSLSWGYNVKPGGVQVPGRGAMSFVIEGDYSPGSVEPGVVGSRHEAHLVFVDVNGKNTRLITASCRIDGLGTGLGLNAGHIEMGDDNGSLYGAYDYAAGAQVFQLMNAALLVAPPYVNRIPVTIATQALHDADILVLNRGNGRVVTFNKYGECQITAAGVAAVDGYPDALFVRSRTGNTNTFRTLNAAGTETFKAGEDGASSFTKATAGGQLLTLYHGNPGSGESAIFFSHGGTAANVVPFQANANSSGANRIYLYQAGAGDAVLQLDAGGAQWAVGVDNSDGDKLKITAGPDVGGSDDLTITPAGYLTLGRTGGRVGLYGGTPVAQAGAIADAAGGAVQDAEARAALNALLAAVRAGTGIGLLAA